MRPDPKRLRHLAAGLVVVALIAVALWPAAVPVDSGSVGRGPVQETVEAEGRTRLRDRYVVAAPVAAIARRLELEPGDRVEAGTVLVVLDPVAAPTLDSRSRAEAEARLAAARAQLAAAREDTRAAEARSTQLARRGRAAGGAAAARAGRRRGRRARGHRRRARRARGRERTLPRGDRAA